MRGQAINRIHEICLEGESIIDSKAISAQLRSEIDAPLHSQEAVAVAAVAAAHDQQAVLIVVLTGAGLMGRLIAKCHPVPPVLLVCESDRVARQAYLSRGLAPMVRAFPQHCTLVSINRDNYLYTCRFHEFANVVLRQQCSIPWSWLRL